MPQSYKWLLPWAVSLGACTVVNTRARAGDFSTAIIIWRKMPCLQNRNFPWGNAWFCCFPPSLPFTPSHTGTVTSEFFNFVFLRKSWVVGGFWFCFWLQKTPCVCMEMPHSCRQCSVQTLLLPQHCQGRERRRGDRQWPWLCGPWSTHSTKSSGGQAALPAGCPRSGQQKQSGLVREGTDMISMYLWPQIKWSKEF